MDKETLKKANLINSKINQLETALDCFEWEPYYGGGSTNPQIIIEFDGGDGRENQKLPMPLNDSLISILKSHIKLELDFLNNELKAL